MSDGGLRQLFRKHAPSAMWQSVETSGVGRGVPDAHYCLPGGVTGWVEFKGTGTNQVGLRPEQVAWIGRYARMGGRVFVAVRYQHEGGPRRGPPVDDLYIYPGLLVSDLADLGLKGVTPSVLLTGGVRQWDWDQVVSLLST